MDPASIRLPFRSTDPRGEPPHPCTVCPVKAGGVPIRNRGVVPWLLVVVLGLTGLTALVAVAPAEKTTVRSGHLEVAFHADFSPRKLLRREREPVAFTFAGTIRTDDYNPHPPPLERLVLGIDGNGRIDGRGLPECGGSSPHFRRSLAEIKTTCRDAIVGGGRAGIEILFTESLIPATTDLVIFNGDAERGHTTLYAMGELTAPIIAPIVMPIEVRKKANGRIGTEAILTVPRIAGGMGSITDLKLTLRRFAGRGQAGVTSLRCLDGQFRVEARARFADTPLIRSELPQSCQAKPELAN